MTKRRKDQPGLLGQIWKRPDPLLAEVGFSAEYLVASVRLLLVLMLVYIPVGLLQSGYNEGLIRVILVGIGAALLESLLVYSAVQRNWGRSWIGFLSSATDVTLVTCALAAYLLFGQPLGVTNSTIVYPFYFLVIAAASLRYDARICLVTGLLAVVEYVLLVLAAVRLEAVGRVAVISPDFGSFNVQDQVGRVVLLAVATGIATILVVRTRETSTLSIRDRLTGLLNRRVFDHRLQSEWARTERDGQSFGVAMIDVDRFKQFNDTYGHEGGDEALRAMGAILQRSFRTTDVVARYGGEEFAVILPSISPINAYKRMETVRLAVARMPVELHGKALPVGLTISVGVAVWPEDGDSAEGVLAVADARLYEAKDGGRNRVVCPIEIDIPQDPLPPPRTAQPTVP